MQRVHQSYRASEEVRAVGSSGGQRGLRDRQAARMAAPFCGIGLENAEHTRIDRLLEGAGATDILASRQPGWCDGCDLDPFRQRAVDRQRLLDPAQAEI